MPVRTHEFSEIHFGFVECKMLHFFTGKIGTCLWLKLYCGIDADSLAIYTRTRAKKCVISTAIVSFRLPQHGALVNLPQSWHTYTHTPSHPPTNSEYNCTST